MATNKNLSGGRIALFVAALAVVWLGGCTPPGPRALLEGKRLIDQGQYEPAVEELKVATKLMATNAQAWNYLGLAYHHTGQAALAVESYRQALKLSRDPRLVIVHYNLGCLLLEQNRPETLEAARDEFMAFTLNQSSSAAGWLKLGTTQLRLRELGKAEKSFKEALRLSPQNVEALNDLGVVAMEANRQRDAVFYFEKAQGQQPNYGPALLNMAIVSQSYLNNRPLALQKYKDYLALNPRPANWESVNLTARQLEQELYPATRSGATTAVRTSEISTNAAKAATIGPARTSPQTGEPSRSELAASAPRIAQPIAQPASQSMPHDTEPTPRTEVVQLPNAPAVKLAEDTPMVTPPSTGTSAMRSSSGEQPPDHMAPAKTEKSGLLQKLNPVNLFRRDPKVVATQASQPASGAAPANQGDLVPASANPRGTSQLPGPPGESPPSTRYTYLSPPKPAAGNRIEAERVFAQGVQAQRDRRVRDAVNSYQAAVQADPSFFEAQSNLGFAAFEAGDMSRSLVAYETALAINPDSFNARFNFALALKKDGYILDAAQELERLSSGDHSGETPAHLAMVHLTLANLYADQFHRPASAKPHYEKVLELDPQNSQATAIRYWLKDNS